MKKQSITQVAQVNSKKNKGSNIKQPQRLLKIGFDLDGVLLYNPARIFRPIIYFIKKYILKRKTDHFYYPKNKFEQLIWLLLHKSSFFPTPGIEEIKKLIKQKRIKAYVVSARYESLKEDFLFWKKKIDPKNLFAGWYYNEKNDQPHLYKEKMIKKLGLDIFVEDNWDIVNYLKTQMSNLKTEKKTKIFWIYNLLDRKIKYQYKFSALKEEIFDVLFFALASAIFFGRLFYMILNFSEFGFSFLKFILINGYPGLSLYGAFFGGFLGIFIFCLLKKIKFFSLIDYFISPLFLALAFGKLGSFFSGVEIGTKTKFFLAVKYVGFDGLRHLTSFYETLFFFLGSYLAYKILFSIRKEKFFSGFLFYFFAWYFSLIYFLFDKIKEHHLYFFGFSFNGVISQIILLTTTIYFLYYFRNQIIISLKEYGLFFQKIYRRAKEKIRK